MKYADTEKNEVIAACPKSGSEWQVPRGHRLWHLWGIDQAEQRGEIQASDPIEPTEAT